MYDLTADDVRASLQGQQMPPIQDVKPSFMERLGQNLGYAGREIAAPLAAGAVSGLEHLGANIANFPAYATEKVTGYRPYNVQIPESFDPLTYTSQTPMARTMGMVGDIAGGMLVPGGAFIKGTKGLGLLKRGLLGTAAGEITGSEEAPGGRELSAAIGGTAAPILGITKSAIGKSAQKMRDTLQEKFSNAYQDLFSQVPDVAVRVPDALNKGSKTWKEMSAFTPKEFKHALEEFRSNPTIESAHKAQSQIGAIQRKIQDDISKRLKKGLSVGAGKQAAYDAAEDLQRRIRGAMMDSFSKAGKPELAGKYGELTRGYAKEFAPYIQGEFHQGLNRHELGKKLLQNLQFGESVGKDIPGYQIRQKIMQASPYLKYSLLPALGVAGAYGIGLPGREYLAKAEGLAK